MKECRLLSSQLSACQCMSVSCLFVSCCLVVGGATTYIGTGDLTLLLMLLLLLLFIIIHSSCMLHHTHVTWHLLCIVVVVFIVTHDFHYYIMIILHPTNDSCNSATTITRLTLPTTTTNICFYPMCTHVSMYPCLYVLMSLCAHAAPNKYSVVACAPMNMIDRLFWFVSFSSRSIIIIIIIITVVIIIIIVSYLCLPVMLK